MTSLNPDFAERLQRVEDQLAIAQLPVRYAMAIDQRDLDAWVNLFVEDVVVTPNEVGRGPLRDLIAGYVQNFYRSTHFIAGHRIELVDEETAVGNVYCRAEHEVADRWVVMAIRYDDRYRKVDNQWFFASRKEEHWYAADLLERPQDVGFCGWDAVPAPRLPQRGVQWKDYWEGRPTAGVTGHPTSQPG